MNVKHLDHLNLTVRNFEETAQWYQRVFGFELVEKGLQDGKPWGILKSGEALLCIYENPGRNYLDRFELEKKEIHGVNHFSFRIPDPKAWEDVVAKEKLSVFYGGAYRYPHSTSWYVIDPTGYEIEVVHWDNDAVKFAS